MANYQAPLVWRKNHPFFKNNAPQKLQNWLTGPESLTQALTCTCTERFSVQVLQEGWQKPTINESRTLNLAPNTLAFVRQVHLLCGSQPWVYARTVIPQKTLKGELQKLTHLGTQPLGAILFSHQLIHRSDIELTKIKATHKTHGTAMTYSPQTRKAIWGRRSLFYVANKPLIVNEIFLPEIKKKKSKKLCQQP